MKNSLRTAACAATAALSLATMASPSWATTYTVAVDGNSSGTAFPYTTTQMSAPTFVVHRASPVTWSCTAVSFNGNIHSGNAAPQVDVNSASSNWSGCALNGATITVTPVNSWYFNATGVATSGTSDVVAGTVNQSGTTFATVSTLSGLCSFQLAGSMSASYDEASQRLVVNEVATSLTVGNLKVVAPVSSGCVGFAAVGNAVDFTGAWNINVTGHPGPAVNIS
jgi:hypothetical protein